VRRCVHPGESALLLQGPEPMIAEEAVVQIGNGVDKLGDIGGEDVVLLAEVARCCRWAPVGYVCCCWI
jgi:hypothetical protein